MHRLWRGLAAIAFLLQCGPLTAAWHRAESANFVIYSDGDAGKLEEYARELEMFDALFRLYFGLPKEPSPNRHGTACRCQ